MEYTRLFTSLLASVWLVSCGGGSGQVASTVDVSEVNSGGSGTVYRSDHEAFAEPLANLDFRGKSIFENGNHLFRTPRGREKGTGPLLNAQTCQGCHILDGRGNPPRDNNHPLTPTEPMSSMFLRISIPGDGGQGGVVPDPVYGGQLQVRSMYGGASNTEGYASHGGSLNGGPALGEVVSSVQYTEINGQYPDGSVYTLLNPTYRVQDASYGPLAADARFSPRVAPGLYGNGLLGAINESDILSRQDPDDADGDGISGRRNRIWDNVNQRWATGRFGLKLGTASVLQQSAGAYRGDMGLTNRFADAEVCTAGQQACISAAATEQTQFHEPANVDVTDHDLAQVEFYTRTLAVPARRGWSASTHEWDEQIQAGRELFFEIGCTGCHQPSYRTGTAAGSVLGDLSNLIDLVLPAPPIAELSNQKIWPFTDLLLHDMGGSCSVSRETAAGDACSAGQACHWVQRCTGLADGRSEFAATGTEWRTAPLWGLGLVQTVNPKAGFLHDGRARTIEEAVLWHGQSEASEAYDVWRKFTELSAIRRAQLLVFLGSM